MTTLTRLAPMPWVRLAAITGGGVACGIQVGKVPVALTEIAASFGFGLQGAALLMSCFAGLAGLGGFGVGLAVARIGARRALLGGLWLLALAGAAGALAPDPALLYAARLTEGAGFILAVVAAPSLLAVAIPASRQPLALAIFSSYMPLGVGLALLGGPLVEAGGWRATWLGAAAMPALAALAAWRVLPAGLSPPVAAALPLGAQWRGVLRARRPLWLAATFAAYAIIYFGLSGFLPAYLIQGFGLPTGEAGLITALVAGVNIGGNLAAGVLQQRGVPAGRIILAAGTLMAGLGAAIFALAPGVAAALVLGLLASGLGGAIPATLFGQVAGSVPERALVAPAMGLILQCNNLGQIIGPVVIAALAGQGWGWVALPLLVAGAVVLAGGWVIGRRRRSPD